MSARARPGLLLLIGAAVALGACATAPSRPEGAPSPAAAAPAPPPPSPLESLAAPHREKALALERDGELRQALDEWKIALTINADDAVARQERKKLEGRIEEAVAARINQGREALRRGAHLEARRYFLAALALAPANRIAFEALQAEVKDVRFVTHTVRVGETLATLAERYYGDRSRLEVIWETNQLPPNPKLVAGATLRIPEIPGVPFLVPGARKDAPPEARPRAEPPPAAAPKEEAAKEEAPAPEVNPLLVEAREAFEKGEYVVALADADKLLANNPRNPEAMELKKAALYRHGKSQSDQKKFEESYRALTQLAKLDPNYQDTPSLLRQTKVRLIHGHYAEGIRLYREENLEGAISQWRIVLEYEPTHADAKKNIDQAERLLRVLQERQKKQQ